MIQRAGVGIFERAEPDLLERLIPALSARAELRPRLGATDGRAIYQLVPLSEGTFLKG